MCAFIHPPARLIMFWPMMMIEKCTKPRINDWTNRTFENWIYFYNFVLKFCCFVQKCWLDLTEFNWTFVNLTEIDTKNFTNNSKIDQKILKIWSKTAHKKKILGQQRLTSRHQSSSQQQSQSQQSHSMRFSSNAPTTPTTTTSIDVIEANLGAVKRGSMTTVAQHDQPSFQSSDMEHLNGCSATARSSVDKMHEIMTAKCDYAEPSPPLHDDDGNV